MILSPYSVTKEACKEPSDFDETQLPTFYYDLFIMEIEIAKVNTVAKIFQHPTPALKVFANSIGQEKVIAMLELHIIALDQFLNFNKAMTQASVHQTAELIYNTYFQLTITDILYVFNNARLGKYGEIIGLNGSKILYWFDQHFDERFSAAASESMREHHNNTYDSFDRSGQSVKVSDLKQQIREENRKHITNQYQKV
jgi:hypothetical protein